MTTPMFRLFTVPGLILGLFDRPHWLSPQWPREENKYTKETIIKSLILMKLKPK